MHLPIRMGPGVFMTFLIMQFCALNTFFDVAKFTTLDTISAASYTSVVIPEYWIVKMFSPQYSIKFL